MKGHIFIDPNLPRYGVKETADPYFLHSNDSIVDLKNIFDNIVTKRSELSFRTKHHCNRTVTIDWWCCSLLDIDDPLPKKLSQRNYRINAPYLTSFMANIIIYWHTWLITFILHIYNYTHISPTLSLALTRLYQELLNANNVMS